MDCGSLFLIEALKGLLGPLSCSNKTYKYGLKNFNFIDSH